jgi:hypothetical protein
MLLRVGQSPADNHGSHRALPSVKCDHRKLAEGKWTSDSEIYLVSLIPTGGTYFRSGLSALSPEGPGFKNGSLGRSDDPRSWPIPSTVVDSRMLECVLPPGT